jgi:periplasmic protein TonB
MSHALPTPLHDVDAKRIAATAFAIAVHVIAFMLLLAPMEWTPPVATVEAPPIDLVVQEKKIKVIPPVPIERPKPLTRPVTKAPPVATPDTPPVISDRPAPMAIPYVPVEPLPLLPTFELPPTGPIALTVLDGPAPPYPAYAIRQNITGRVVLRIEVDASGRPVSGDIERSSGSSLLDKAALKFVLAKWRFQPAQHGGQAIAATCLVPIEFSLD